MDITVQRVEVKEVMADPPGVILLPAVHHHPVFAQVAHVRVRFIALSRWHIDHEIGDEAISLYVRVLQSVFADNLQQVHIIAPVILTSVRVDRRGATVNNAITQ